MQKIIQALPDALIVAGGCALSYGAGLLHPAAGFITGGLLMLGFGWVSGRASPAKAEE
jgi:hypothetical protein